MLNDLLAKVCQHPVDPELEIESVSDSDSKDPVVLSYTTICDIIKLLLGDTKIPFVIKKEAQAISNVLEGEISVNVPELYGVPDLTVQTSAVSVFDQVSLATMAKAQAKDSVLGLVTQYVHKGGNQRALLFQKSGVRQYESTCCSLIDWWWNSILHQIYITNDVESNQLVLLREYHHAMLHMLHDDYGHQGLDWTLALVRERFYWGTMNQDVTEYDTNSYWCHVTKGHYTGPETQQKLLVANNPLDLLCIDFLKLTLQKVIKKISWC